MAYSIESIEKNTFELADAGMACLTEKFGPVGAEAFIALVLREKLDYTKWRKTYYGGMNPGEFHEKALAYAKEHPYTGDAEVIWSKTEGFDSWTAKRWFADSAIKQETNDGIQWYMEQHGKTMCVYPDEAIMMFPGLNRLRKRFAIVDIMGEITD